MTAINWTRLIGVTNSRLDTYGRSVVIDDLGFIYLTGFTEGDIAGQKNTGSVDGFIGKYSKSGEAIWTKLFGDNLTDTTRKMVQGKNGNLYLVGSVGTAMPGIGTESTIYCYSPMGDKLWATNFGSSVFDNAEDIAMSPADDLYIVGYTNGDINGIINQGQSDGYIAKFSKDGIHQWTTLIGQLDSDYLTSVAWRDKFIYVTGTTMGKINSNSIQAGSGDIFIAKYSEEGVNIWTRQFGSNKTDYTADITVDKGGNIYLVGYTLGDLNGIRNNGRSDSFVAKFDNNGATLWTSLIGQAATDMGVSVKLDGSDSVYVLSSIESVPFNTTQQDISLRKYSKNGEILWENVYGTPHGDFPRDLSIDSDGQILITGDTVGNLGGQIKNGLQDAFLLSLIENIYTITPSATSTNEGATLTTSVATTNVASGTKLYYALSGTGITTADFSAGALRGEGIIDSTGKLSFSNTLANDITTEGVETLEIKLFSDEARLTQLGSTASVSINDISINPFNLDVDGDGKVTALGDGLMVIRKLFGAAFAGDALTNKAISPTATRTTSEIHHFIESGISTGMLDVDKDGKTTALGDGLMIIRHLFGAAFAGEALTNKAISPASPYFGPPVDHLTIANTIDSMKVIPGLSA